jgi:REP element-mobilizing transposase RayT
MPAEFRDRLGTERRIRIAELERLKRHATPAELHAIDQLIHERAEECLDQGGGACWMRDSRIADIVAGAVTHFDESRYLLFAWSVMPNHVHVVLKAHERIDRILHSWKSLSAKEANKLLNRQGTFWQEDYFDHTIRDPREFEETIRYVADNPAKAGLTDWPWVKVYSERL